MAQQMVNGSHYDGSVTITIRQSPRYAVVNPPFSGAHRKPQDDKSKAKRKAHWKRRNADLILKVKKNPPNPERAAVQMGGDEE